MQLRPALGTAKQPPANDCRQLLHRSGTAPGSGCEGHTEANKQDGKQDGKTRLGYASADHHIKTMNERGRHGDTPHPVGNQASWWYNIHEALVHVAEKREGTSTDAMHALNSKGVLLRHGTRAFKALKNARPPPYPAVSQHTSHALGTGRC